MNYTIQNATKRIDVHIVIFCRTHIERHRSTEKGDTEKN